MHGTRSPHHRPSGGAEDQKDQGTAADEPRRKPSVGRTRHCEQGERGPPREGGGEVPTTPGPGTETHPPEQRDRRGLMGSGERPHRERDGGEQAEQGREPEHARIDTERDRHGQQRLEQPARRHRRQRPHRETDEDPEPRDRRQLREIGREDDGARGADALQGGDDPEPGVEPGPHRVADPDSAHQQRGQPYQAQERAQPLHHPLDSRRGSVEGAHPPPCLPESLVQFRPDRAHVHIGREPNRVLVIHEAAFADEVRVGERIETHQHPRPEAERPARAHTVGFAFDRPPHLERDAADGERISLPELQALGERGIHERPPSLAGPRERRGKANRGAVSAPRLHAAEQGVAAVHRLELDEHSGIVPGTARHGAHFHEVRDRLREPLQVSAVGRGEIPIDGAQGQVASEDLAPVRAQPGDDRGRRRLHPGDGGDPEGETAEEDAEPAQRAGTVAQLSKREPKGYGRHGDVAMRPSAMRMVRPHRSARRVSCVISTRAAPLSRLRANR